MTKQELILTFLLIWLGTVLTRFLPYLIFPEGKPVPKIIQYLGKVLGPAVFGLLVVYCLRNTDLIRSFSHGGSHGIPEISASILTLLIYRWKKQMILSMAAGTILYMVLVQVVFIQ
ncbi:MAG: AzlD domain-containing protein [Lachnospiraceae bacterium]|nr:AzlD domain-containing protein [Lachnospiraceae bacterium]